jgi:hypothetical protein
MPTSGREHDAATGELKLELSAGAEAELPTHGCRQGEPAVMVQADLGHAAGLMATGCRSRARGEQGKAWRQRQQGPG